MGRSCKKDGSFNTFFFYVKMRYVASASFRPQPQNDFESIPFAHCRPSERNRTELSRILLSCFLQESIFSTISGGSSTKSTVILLILAVILLIPTTVTL